MLLNIFLPKYAQWQIQRIGTYCTFAKINEISCYQFEMYMLATVFQLHILS